MIHVFGFGASNESEPFHGRSVNCDAPEAATAEVIYHRDTVLSDFGLRAGGYCPHCAKNFCPAGRQTGSS